MVRIGESVEVIPGQLTQLPSLHVLELLGVNIMEGILLLWRVYSFLAHSNHWRTCSGLHREGSVREHDLLYIVFENVLLCVRVCGE
jgi:hypothetical protein